MIGADILGMCHITISLTECACKFRNWSSITCYRPMAEEVQLQKGQHCCCKSCNRSMAKHLLQTLPSMMLHETQVSNLVPSRCPHHTDCKDQSSCMLHHRSQHQRAKQQQVQIKLPSQSMRLLPLDQCRLSLLLTEMLVCLRLRLLLYQFEQELRVAGNVGGDL